MAALLSNTQVIHYTSLALLIEQCSTDMTIIFQGLQRCGPIYMVYIIVPILPSEMEVALPEAISWMDWIGSIYLRLHLLQEHRWSDANNKGWLMLIFLQTHIFHQLLLPEAGGH